MALEDILQEIEERGKKEMEELSRSYENRLESLKKKYLSMEESTKADYESSIKSEVESLKRNIVSSAQMEALRIVRSKEKQIMDQTLQTLEDSLASIREKKYYPDLLNSMKEIGQKALGKDCRIFVDKSDMKYVTGSEELKNDDLLRRYGGMVSASKDGTMEIDLRIFSIYRDLKDEISGIISGSIGE